MIFRSLAPKASASTNSATLARNLFYSVYHRFKGHMPVVKVVVLVTV